MDGWMDGWDPPYHNEESPDPALKTTAPRPALFEPCSIVWPTLAWLGARQEAIRKTNRTPDDRGSDDKGRGERDII
eukprot:496796-Pelagomonas_calceolata.AAC.10